MELVMDSVKGLINGLGLSERDLKSFLRRLVADLWPSLPEFSKLEAPLVEEVQKASVGVGAVLTFREYGVQKVVLARAGSHYPRAVGEPHYMIPGGFINLSFTEGSTQVAASSEPESPRDGGAREIEEELRVPNGTPKGAPLLSVDPKRLKPLDTVTLNMGPTNKGLAIGMMMELSPQEVATVKAHVERMATDATYRDEVAKLTINSETGKPEVADVMVVPLRDLAEGKFKLLHGDQISLFKLANEHFSATQVGRG